ncbi:hypothetical protein CFE70_007681 [Pyrenophora teres f. teres 0-1]
MAQQSTPSTQSKDITRTANIDRPTSITRAMTDGSIPTGFVASRVSRINMATPDANANSDGIANLSVSVMPEAHTDRGRQAGDALPPTHLSATRYRRLSNSDRSALPSQVQYGPPRTSLSRYRPVVSMPLSATSSFGGFSSEGSPNSDGLVGLGFGESSNFDKTAATLFRGHRRNRTEISDKRQIGTLAEALKGTIVQPNVEKTATSSKSSLDGQNKNEASTLSTRSMPNPPLMQEESVSSSKKNLLTFVPKHLEQNTSTDSLDSTPTVESDSWNPAPTNGPAPDRPLRRVAKFNLETGSFSQTSMIPMLENTTIEEARGMYPLENVQYGGATHGCQVYDFAYPGGSRGKRVRFASKSDHAPSVHYNSSSESGASTKAVCGRGVRQAEDWEEENWMEDEQEIGVGGTILRLPRYQADTSGDEIEPAQEIRRKPLPREVDIKSRRPAAPSPTGFQQEGGSEDVPTSSNSRPRVLRKKRTEIARRPLPSNAGILNRDFTFPPRDTGNQTANTRTLVDSPPLSPHSSPQKEKKHHRRSSSSAKLLSVFSSKDATETDEGGHKKTASFVRRIRRNLRGTIFRRSWDGRESADKSGKTIERQ